MKIAVPGKNLKFLELIYKVLLLISSLISVHMLYSVHDELDGRKIDRKALEEIRIRAVKRVEAGESPEVVIKALGLTRPRIYEWIAKYREGGIEALRRRKAPGKTPKLAGNQLKKIYRLVVGTDPRQLKFEFALWTRGMIRELISESSVFV